MSAIFQPFNGGFVQEIKTKDKFIKKNINDKHPTQK